MNQDSLPIFDLTNPKTSLDDAADRRLAAMLAAQIAQQNQPQQPPPQITININLNIVLDAASSDTDVDAAIQKAARVIKAVAQMNVSDLRQVMSVATVR